MINSSLFAERCYTLFQGNDQILKKTDLFLKIQISVTFFVLRVRLRTVHRWKVFEIYFQDQDTFFSEEKYIF